MRIPGMIRLGQFRGTRIRFGGTAPTSSFPFHSPHRYAVARRFIVSSIPRVVQAGRKEYPRLSDEKAARRYFDLLEKIEAAKSAKDYHALLHGCIASLPLVERYTKWFKKAQSGNPVQVPAIYYACRFLPITGGRGQLDNILELVEFLPEIDHYREGVQRAIASIRTVESIRAYLTKNAGTKQNQLKKALAYDDGRYLSQLVKDMEHMGQLERRKSGNTYELHTVQSQAADKPEREAVLSTKPCDPPAPPPTIPRRKQRRWWQRKS